MGYIGMSGSEGYGFEQLWHDSDLETFSHNPTDGSFAPLAGILRTRTFISSSTLSNLLPFSSVYAEIVRYENREV